MTEEEAAKLVADTLAWAIRGSSLPAIKNAIHNGGRELFFESTFTGEKFSVTVREVA